jgi:HEAT repeat protein
LSTKSEVDQELPDSFFFAAHALSRFDTTESEAALRRAMERANRAKDEFSVQRKGWAAFCLALMGKPDVVDKLNEGANIAGRSGLTSSVTYVEGAAFVTSPESVPLLLGQLGRYAEDPQLMPLRRYAIRGLRRIGDPSALPNLIELLSDPHPAMRREAALALGSIEARGVVPALIKALDDEDSATRHASARALGEIRPDGIRDVIREKLESEEDPHVRGPYYSLLAQLGGRSELGTLLGHWGHPAASDRLNWVVAVGSLRATEALDLLSEATRDSDTRVATRAIAALADLGTPEAIDRIIGVLGERNFALVQIAARQLERIDATRAIPMITDRLLRAEMSQVVTDPRIRDRVPILGEVLIALGSTDRLDEVRAAAARQRDPTLLRYLDGLLLRMDALAKNGNKVKRWAEITEASDEGLRRLAYEQLGQIGGEKAAGPLTDAFARAEPSDGVLILRALGAIDSPQSRELFRRVLLSPDFDPPARKRQREMAAWGARRLGGADMLEALRESVERRLGRDGRVMIYLGLLGGESAIPTLTEYRKSRWHFLHALTGEEQIVLDRLVRDLRAGRTTDALDVPPGRIVF